MWKPKDQMLLVDSVARRVPIGAVTLYAQELEDGYTVYEVIDGKQRLTALLDFLDNKYEIKTDLIKNSALDDDEFDLENDDVTVKYHGRRFNELETPLKISLTQYQIPIFLVHGGRSEAIRSFARMNKSPYSLKPQEIRNAFYASTYFLQTVIEATRTVDGTALPDEQGAAGSLLVKLGVISAGSWDRMQDIQLVSELLQLIMQGPQNRRDKLDDIYSLYRDPSGPAKKTLNDARARLEAILLQLWKLTGGRPLQAFSFPPLCEHDLYGIVGAFNKRGLLVESQVALLGEELMDVIGEFRSAATRYQDRTTGQGAVAPGEFDPLVEKYGKDFLRGQINSLVRRERRIEVWVEVLNSMVATLDEKSSFSPTQRWIIWANSADKICARCMEKVEWENYQAGHIQAWALGGRTVVQNGRVEHSWCNQSAGAS